MRFFRILKHLNFKRYVATSLAACFLVLLSGHVSFAQNNPYSIDDECYQLFLKAEANYSSSKGLEYAMAMRSRAKDIDDTKAETLSYVLEMEYYRNHLDMKDKFLSSVASVKAVALRNKDLSNYYYAYAANIEYLLSLGQSISALSMADTMLKDAESTGNLYGLRACYYAMAGIYQARGAVIDARKCYNEAVNYSVKDHYEDMMDILLAKSETYSELDSALYYINNAKPYMVSPNDTLSVIKSECFAYGYASDAASYEESRTKYKRLFARYGIEKKAQDTQKFAFFDSFLLDKDNDKAFRIASGIPDKRISLTFKKNVALAEGNYEAAYKYLDDIVSYNDSLSVEVSGMDIGDVDSRFRNDLVLKEKENIELTSEKEILRQRNNFYLVLFGIFFVGLFLVVDFVFFYIREKNKAIENQKELTEDLIAMNEQAQAAKEMALKAKDEAIKANNMKTTFVQNMSHEIRTPLNAIVGFSQLMSLPDGFLTEEEKQQYGKYIMSNSDLLTMLIDDILNINDIESGNYKVNIASASCNEMCRQAMNTAESRVPAGVKYTFDTEVDDSFMVTTDARRIRQILINFLTNACKHTEKGEINVHCSVNEDKEIVVFSVTDTGTGVPPEKAEEIFERFTKLDSFKQGAGLGLNICRMISEKLGGTVKLDTTYTDGARFLLTIPFKYKNPENLFCESI